MKVKTVFSLAIAAVSFFFVADASLFLVDFGNDGLNGNTTSSPDVNGNYWNNSFVGGYAVSNMLAANGVASTIDLSYITAVAVNASSLNVAGAPSPFSISTAYQDAIFTTGTSAGTGITVLFSQLDPGLKYKFTLFGSRSATDSRTSNYEMVGAITNSGSLQTSGVNLGGAGINYNRNNVLVLGGADGMAPGGSNQITLTIYASSTDVNKFAYLNAMQIEAIPEPATLGLLIVGFCSIISYRRRRSGCQLDAGQDAEGC